MPQRHPLPRQLSGGNFKLPRLFGKMLSWCVPWSHLMVIDNLDIDRARRATRPLKADPPLLVDTDPVLALPIALESFQLVAGKSGEIF